MGNLCIYSKIHDEKSKMNSRIRFTIEMMNEALEDICKNKELYSAKDRLKATQDYLALFIFKSNEQR